jgi:hypothetical protein
MFNILRKSLNIKIFCYCIEYYEKLLNSLSLSKLKFEAYHLCHVTNNPGMV